jgi:hypothetical protein
MPKSMSRSQASAWKPGLAATLRRGGRADAARQRRRPFGHRRIPPPRFGPPPGRRRGRWRFGSDDGSGPRATRGGVRSVLRRGRRLRMCVDGRGKYSLHASPRPGEPIACTDLRDKPTVQGQFDGYRAAFEHLLCTERFEGGVRRIFKSPPGLDASPNFRNLWETRGDS